MLSTSRLVVVLAMGGAIAAGGALWGCGGRGPSQEWPMSAGNLAGTRAAAGSGISAGNVARLRVRWRFSGRSSSFASTPVADEAMVYVQDLRSNVFALDRATGAVRWAQRFRGQKHGSNGLAVDEGRVYGETERDAFALAASNGRELWRRPLANVRRQIAETAPVAWKGLLFVSTVDPEQSRHGTIYALDAATGVVRWTFKPIERPGPISIDAAGRLYAATLKFVLDARSGRLLTRERGRLRTTPILATNAGTDAAFAAGKSGLVIAWNRETTSRLWNRDLGMGHTACRGVESPMAYADDRLFVPVTDVCGGRGGLIALDAASGRTLWQRNLASADVGCATVSNNVVFTSASNGTVYAFGTRDGRLLWRAGLLANVRACPAIVGDTLLIGSGPALVALELS